MKEKDTIAKKQMKTFEKAMNKILNTRKEDVEKAIAKDKTVAKKRKS